MIYYQETDTSRYLIHFVDINVLCHQRQQQIPRNSLPKNIDELNERFA